MRAGGWEPGLAGLKALRDRSLDVDLLMVVAAIGAAAIGQVFDGALLIVIFATSGAWRQSLPNAPRTRCVDYSAWHPKPRRGSPNDGAE